MTFQPARMPSLPNNTAPPFQEGETEHSTCSNLQQSQAKNIMVGCSGDLNFPLVCSWLYALVCCMCMCVVRCCANLKNCSCVCTAVSSCVHVHPNAFVCIPMCARACLCVPIQSSLCHSPKLTILWGFCSDPPTQILPGLFLGSAQNAINRDELLELKIGSILNCG